MLGEILNELAQVEAWLSECAKGHETHDPDHCVWAEMLLAIADLGGEDEADDASIVTFSLICLLAKTKNPAKAGLLIVDKVRQMCAAMAQDRIQARRNAATEAVHDWSNRVNQVYNNPN